MKQAIFLPAFIGVFGPLFLAGCTDGSGNKQPPNVAKSGDSKIEAALAKLDPVDRKLAEAQKWCAVEDENRLGVMGVPVKVMVKDQPVFLCCKSCLKRALADPDRTITKVEELKTKTAGPGGQ